MDSSEGSSAPLAGAAKRFVHRLMAIGENRVQLFAVEVREERDRLLDMVLLAVAVAALGLLCGIAWGAALVIVFWQYGPVFALLLLGAAFAIFAIVLCRKLMALRRQQQILAATLDQFRKDRECLEKS